VGVTAPVDEHIDAVAGDTVETAAGVVVEDHDNTASAGASVVAAEEVVVVGEEVVVAPGGLQTGPASLGRARLGSTRVPAEGPVRCSR